jgi:hypothetical protein
VSREAGAAMAGNNVWPGETRNVDLEQGEGRGAASWGNPGAGAPWGAWQGGGSGHGWSRAGARRRRRHGWA